MAQTITDNPEGSSEMDETLDRKELNFPPDERRAIVVWTLLAVSLLPFMVKYFPAMWRQTLYQFFPFLLVSIGYLVFRRHDRVVRLPETNTLRGRVCFGALSLGALLLAGAAVLGSSWLGAVVLVIWLGAFLASQREFDGRWMGYLAIPMVLFIRSPMLGTYTVMERLQRITTSLASIFLDAFGVIHSLAGNTIALPSKTLFVAEACSGVQSLFTVLFLSLLLMAYRRRSIVALPVYLFVALVLAIVGNVSRVTTIALAEAWFRVDLTSGFIHELVGYLALAFAAALLYGIDSITSLSPFRRDGEMKEIADLSKSNSAFQERFSLIDWRAEVTGSPRQWQAFIGITLLSGLLMGIQFLAAPSKRPSVVSTNQVLFDPSSQLITKPVPEVQVLDHQVNRDAHGDRSERFGMNSDIYQCGFDGNQGQLVFSQPYMGWHELTVCYKVLDWQMVSRTPISPRDGSTPIVVAEFVGEAGRRGTLFFTAIDSDGHIPRVPGHSPYARALAPLHPLIMDDFAEITGSSQTIMLQYWITSEDAQSAQTIQRVVDMLAAVRQTTSERLSSDLQAT
ncbi:MAG: exosortase U [Planctomycetota bacterium]